MKVLPSSVVTVLPSPPVVIAVWGLLPSLLLLPLPEVPELDFEELLLCWPGLMTTKTMTTTTTAATTKIASSQTQTRLYHGRLACWLLA